MLRTNRLAIIFIAFIIIGLKVIAGTTITPEMIASLKRVYHVSINPKGTAYLYTLSVPRSEDDEPGGSYTEIWRADLEGEKVDLITSTDENCWSPAWSPKGQITFLSTQEDMDDHVQIYTRSKPGKDFKKITNHTASIRSFK